jgi:hypothetical protein
MQVNFHDLKADMTPKSWLSKFRQTSVVYLISMLMFYHGIGLLLLLIGTSIVQTTITNYQTPSLPHYFSLVLAAGPTEETLFFGLPYYAFGNHYVVMAGGIIWVMLHILNTSVVNIQNLAYANWLFVIPSFFFSFRCWVSGKGWFAIITHSGWNGIFFSLGCSYHEYSCLVFPSGGNYMLTLSTFALSALLLGLTYLLYRRRSSISISR